MKIEQLKKGQRVYVRHPERAYRLECTVIRVYSEPLPSGESAVVVQNGDAGRWISGVSQLEDADLVDAEEKQRREEELTEKHRRRLEPIIKAWESGLRRPCKIAAACELSPDKASSQIKQAIARGFVKEDARVEFTDPTK